MKIFNLHNGSIKKIQFFKKWCGRSNHKNTVLYHGIVSDFLNESKKLKEMILKNKMVINKKDQKISGYINCINEKQNK